jgi:hypothetical protein
LQHLIFLSAFLTPKKNICGDAKKALASHEINGKHQGA